VKALGPIETIEKKIPLIRGHKVMLSMHLAELYGVETRALNQAIKRNIHRFPGDFMFRINESEAEQLVSQNVIPHRKHLGGALPYAFTEQGVAMLSSVLNSERAIEVNILIMRAFVKLREMLATHKDLARRLDEMEKKYDVQFRVVFEAIRQLMAPAAPGARQAIGFTPRKEK
jgi:phage regulator Rha-like protein